MHHTFRAAGSVALVLLTAACGDSPVGSEAGDPDAGERVVKAAPSFVEDIQPIMDRWGCAQSTCHGAGQGGLRLTSDPATNWRALVNVPSTNQREFLRVEPYDAQNSYVIMLFENRQSPLFPPMPDGGPIDDVDLTNFRRWIDQGAAFN